MERLRLVTQALQAGHKPSAVVSAPPDALRRLLLVTDQLDDASADDGLPDTEESLRIQATWRQFVVRYDADALDRDMKLQWGRRGGVGFLSELMSPFLVDIGERWQRGELSVRHEHFASERVRDFLTSQWRPLSDSARGPRVICGTLAGEQHALGLQMAATVLALTSNRVVFLGADLPVEDIAEAAHDYAARAVVLSCAASAPSDIVAEQLADLLHRLDPAVALVAGGDGVPPDPPGVLHLTDFNDFRRWAEGL